MARIAVIAALILSLGVFASCGKRRPYSPPRNQGNQEPISPSPSPNPMVAEPVAFAGESFFTDADVQAMGVPTDPRVKSLAYDKSGNQHRYQIGTGELEVKIYPCVDSSAASQRSSDEFNGEKINGVNAQNMGKALYFDSAQESIAGSNSWVVRVIRVEGQGLVKIGFASGPFYVKALWAESAASKEALEEIKAKAVRAAKYIAGKLGR